MIKEESRSEVERLLRQCATEGTFWNRHFKSDDVIDLWRETNRILARYGEEQISFDVFYIALQKFKTDYAKQFDEAAKEFIMTLEEKPEVTVQQKPDVRPRTRTAGQTRRVKRTSAGNISITGTLNPKGEPPIEMTVISSADDWARLTDYFSRNHERFIDELFFTFLAAGGGGANRD